MPRFYADENFPLPAVEELRKLGHDVLTAYESGKAGQSIPDELVLAFAIVEKRILITLNRKHFIRLQPYNLSILGLSFVRLIQTSPDLLNEFMMLSLLMRVSSDSFFE